ncbi:MAG: hypothetical protein V4439_03960 [Patescibacteria group bacterium]
MPIIFFLYFVMVVLPVFIVTDGYEKFEKHMDKKNWWWNIPYVLVFILIILAVILYFMGYR